MSIQSRVYRFALASFFVVGVVSTSFAADPPEGQTYTGAKKCASCHFKQFVAWKKTGHAKALDLLTAKYEKDPECLKCHSTGYGEATGFKDMATTSSLAGNSCEVCHGPGSEHEKVAQSFGNKKLTPEDEKVVRDSIWLMLPENVCVTCHMVQAHKKSSTPTDMQSE